MEQLKGMKEQLISLMQGELSHVDKADAKELGEVMDMIKDIAETEYYCAITEAMEKSKDEKEERTYYYTIPDYRYPSYRDDDVYYYGGNSRGSNGSWSNGDMVGNNPSMVARGGMGRRMYTDDSMNMMRDAREGRSPISRKMYMESKEMHQGTPAQMKELEKYMQELTRDITEMIEDASPEEKQLLQQKISMLAQKIAK